MRLRGDIALAATPQAAAEAEQNYVGAINVAQRQSARSLELRAATSLVRLLQAQGRSDEARARLAPLLAWFTEGLDTADLWRQRPCWRDWRLLRHQRTLAAKLVRPIPRRYIP